MSASLQRQLPHASSVSLNGRQVPYVTVANPRRKSISIYWTGRVEVRCPPGTTKRRVEAVLKEHADWVLAHLPAEGVPASRYCDGGVIPYRGGQAVLVLGQERSVIMKVGDRTEVWLKVPKGADEDAVKMALALALKKYAWRVINDCWMRVIETAPKLPVVWRLSSAKTRWGSCSSKGNLNFNYQLYYMPQELMDYVVVHELCHRKYMNHSKQFWAEVAKVMPDYKKCERWLKEEGSLLIG